MCIVVKEHDSRDLMTNVLEKKVWMSGAGRVEEFVMRIVFTRAVF